MTILSLDTLNAADEQDFAAALGDIFEHSPWAAEATIAARPFGSLQALLDAMIAVVRAAGPQKQLALLAAHPDLAGKAAQAGTLTAESNAEQASAGLDRLTAEELSAFHRLNDGYRQKFGIPFIVCVRRHTKGSILRLFEKRLGNDVAAEQATALDEVFRIAALRLDQRVQATDRLPLAGRLSTHVLDTHGGGPAKDIPVALWELGPGEARRLVTKTVTNRDGRTDAPLIGGRPVPIGTYELVFEVGPYFRARGVPLADPPFLDVVPIRFAVAEAEGHYHVPLLVTPWSFSTYRGS